MRKSLFLSIVSSICITTFFFWNFAGAQVLPNQISPAASGNSANSGIKISMDFEGASLNDVLKIFSQQSGMNFIASEEIKDKKVTMYLDGVSVQDALNSIINANNLTYEQPAGSNIFIVRELGISSTKLMTKVFYLKYARVKSSRLNKEIEDRMNSEGTSSSGSSGTSTSNTSTTETSDTGTGTTNSDDDGRDLVSMVQKVLSSSGKISEDARANSLIVTDVQAQFALIEETIAAIDVPVPQVLLEVEMLDVSKELLDQIGLKYPSTWVQYGGASLSPLTMRTAWPIPGSAALSKNATGTVGGTGTDITQAATMTIFGGGVSFDLIRTDTRTKYLARPRILTLSNETAEIKISQNEAIGSTSSTSGTAATVTTGAAERSETGVTLRVTPQVDDKDGFITLYVEPTVTKTGSAVTFTADDKPNTYKNPEMRQTKSVVRIKDGETIVLGGLIRTDKKRVTTKVPVLGDIPLLGKLFTHEKDDNGEERELIVFVTPRIIKETAKTPVTQQREQSMPFEPTSKEQTLVADRGRNINETLNQVSVQNALPK